MIKQTLKRQKLGFSESHYGFRSFGQLLEEAAKRGALTLERDKKSGGYITDGASLPVVRNSPMLLGSKPQPDGEPHDY